MRSSASLAAAHRRVLLVDLDPQGNATMGSGINKRNLTHTVYHVLLGVQPASAVRVAQTKGMFDLLPSNRELAGAVQDHARLTDLELIERLLGPPGERGR